MCGVGGGATAVNPGLPWPPINGSYKLASRLGWGFEGGGWMVRRCVQRWDGADKGGGFLPHTRRSCGSYSSRQCRELLNRGIRRPRWSPLRMDSRLVFECAFRSTINTMDLKRTLAGLQKYNRVPRFRYKCDEGTPQWFWSVRVRYNLRLLRAIRDFPWVNIKKACNIKLFSTTSPLCPHETLRNHCLNPQTVVSSRKFKHSAILYTHYFNEVV